MKQHNFDERQLWMRGEVFKHSLLLMGALVLLNAFLIDSGLVLVEGMWGNILIVDITAAFALIEMTVKGAFDFDDKRMAFIIVLLGVCGAIVFVLGIGHMLGGEKWIQNNCLTKNGAQFIMALLFLAVPVVYFAKRISYHRGLSD